MVSGEKSIVVCEWVRKEFPAMRQNEKRIKFTRVETLLEQQTSSRESWTFHRPAANFYSLKTENSSGVVALGDLLGCYRVGILPDMGSGNWLVWIQRLMATVAMGFGQFQRFLSCDLGTGLHKIYCNSYTCFYILKVFFAPSMFPPPTPRLPLWIWLSYFWIWYAYVRFFRVLFLSGIYLAWCSLSLLGLWFAVIHFGKFLAIFTSNISSLHSSSLCVCVFQLYTY